MTIDTRLGQRSIPPEQLLGALLLQVLHSVGCEPRLMQQLAYNMLCRWFVRPNLNRPVGR